jgi:hypothetical protein
MMSCASARATAAPPGLDVEAAGVEAHAFADDADLRMRRIAPLDIDQARRDSGRATDSVNGREPLLEQIVADDHAMSRSVATRNLHGCLRQCFRRQVVGRRVDEVACERSRGS